MSPIETIVVLDDNKIKQVLKIKDVIKIVEEGFRKKQLGLIDLPPKSGVKLNIQDAFADSMPVSVFNKKGGLETFGLKWISGFPDNFKKNLPYLNPLIILNEPKNGLPIAILRGNWITAMRTCAVSAICAKYLAPRVKDPVIGIFGLGLQAYVHVLAFKEIYKKPRFILFNHDQKFLDDFLKKLPHEKFKTTEDPREIARESDIILTATTFPKRVTPYVFASDLKNDVLILPLEYGARIDPGLYKHLDEIYTDDVSQYELKSKLRNYFPPNTPKIKKEVAELITSNYKRDKKPKKILVFNLGIALFDILTAGLFIKKFKG